MERKKLSDDEVGDLLVNLPDWRSDNGHLKRRFEFANFADSLAFVNKVGEIAEAADHHPDISFGWGYAEIATTTHDRGGMTDVDFALVRQINQL
jgi:4a-hydroxytetrahydrobiopterin dehydratase